MSFDPPWLDDVADGLPDELGDAALPAMSDDPVAGEPDRNQHQEGEHTDAAVPDATTDVESTEAPPKRYAETRRHLTDFIRSGNKQSLQKSLSSFVNKGLGGAKRASSRMRVGTKAAASVAGFLIAARDGTSQDINAWVQSVRDRGLSADDLILEVLNHLIPTGGTADEESARRSMDEALSELYQKHPDIDLLAPTDEQVVELIAYTIGHDVFHRIELELGRAFERLQYSARIVQERINDARDYVLAVALDETGRARDLHSLQTLKNIADLAMRNVMEVFGAV